MVVAARPGLAGGKGGSAGGGHPQDHRRAPLAAPARRPRASACCAAPPARAVKLCCCGRAAIPSTLTLMRERLTPVPPKGRMLEDGAGYLKVAEFGPRAADEVRGEVEALRKRGAKRPGAGPAGSGLRRARRRREGGRAVRAGRRAGQAGHGAGRGEQLFAGRSRPTCLGGAPGRPGGQRHRRAGRGRGGGRARRGPRARSWASPRSAAPRCRRRYPSPRAALVLTTGKYTTPKGTAIHGRGLYSVGGGGRARDEDEAEAAPDPADPILEKALELLNDAAAAKKAA